MNVTETSLSGVFLIEPRVFPDDRGFFFESYNRERFRAAGIPDEFVQDNHSRSKKNVVRGLHYQEPNGQGKLVRCARGAIFDVAVDLRSGKWIGVELSDQNNRMLWVPRGYAHGFCALTEADLVYKCTDYYAPQSERTIIWNDPDIAIKWPIAEADAIVSDKDLAGVRLRDAVMPTLV
ncbi:MAG TPA: dTDP-4-dehydrorhamnose 3,5-epimerase [Thermoanaerobaculia bacterium]|nr:dTDP-4-dehydrorhamnose 3,5-epimerase [Thermoanaerobaculia bacterium]